MPNVPGATFIPGAMFIPESRVHSFEFKFAHPNENVIFFWSPNWVHWKIGPINVTVGLIRNALLFWLLELNLISAAK